MPLPCCSACRVRRAQNDKMPSHQLQSRKDIRSSTASQCRAPRRCIIRNPACAGVADVQLTDPLAARPNTLAAQRLRAGAELDAARGDWAAVAAALAPALGDPAPPYWALGLHGWALHQQGHLEVCARRRAPQAVPCCLRMVLATPQARRRDCLAASSLTAMFSPTPVKCSR